MEDELMETGDEAAFKEFTHEELAATAKVLGVLNAQPELKRLAQSSQLIRDVLALGRKIFAPSDEEKRNHSKKQKKNLRETDHAKLEVSGIRKMRQVKMVGMIGGSVDLKKPPRIATQDKVDEFIKDEEEKTLAAIRAEGEKLQQQQHEQAKESSDPVFTHVEAGPNVDPQQHHLPPPQKLNYRRSCHICGSLFDELHAFYDQLCPTCATFNYSKRFSKADMTGRVCIVTGARVKIGYAIALKLLRMNAAKVIVTTRFPHDAARRFALEPDSADFKNRLTVYGLDFRDIRMMHHFCAHVRATEKRLDVIINNAAQTVRKPPGFYGHLMEGESVGMLESHVLEKVEVVDVFRVGDRYLFGSPDIVAAEAKRLAASASSSGSAKAAGKLNLVGGGDVVELATDAAAGNGSSVPLMATPAQNAIHVGNDFIPSDPGFASSLTASGSKSSGSVPDQIVNEAAAMSQIPMMASDLAAASQATHLFPQGIYDRDDQQVDLRTTNSWNLEMGQISTAEMMECHVINAFAPWVLISELKSLMEASGPLPGAPDLGEGAHFDKYVVNVSAMEGQFYRNKTILHPHTNMAKASLNMMTRTASAGFAAVGIFMTAVDTGWITDEQPQHLWEKRAIQPPPLDEWDAAMRVLDPVLCGIRGEERVWGVFLKNYFPTRW